MAIAVIGGPVDGLEIEYCGSQYRIPVPKKAKLVDPDISDMVMEYHVYEFRDDAYRYKGVE